MVTKISRRPDRATPLVRRLDGFTSTVFAEMSLLAAETGSFNLGQGFPDSDTPAAVVEAATRAMCDGVNQYTHPLGEPVLRQAIADHQQRFWDMTVDPQREVLVTAGATEAIAATVLSLVEPDEEVLMFEPYFDSYAAVVALAGARRRVVTLRESTRYDPESGEGASWSFDLDEVRSAIGPRTRMMLLNSPHNPTGKVFTVAELIALGELAVEHDLIIVSDEVYEHLAYTREHVPIASLPGLADRTVTISSAGKTLSCTGWKIGWVMGPERFVAAIRAAKQFLTYVNGGPLQYGVAAGLGLGDDYFDDLRDSLIGRRDRLNAGLRNVGFSVAPAEGGYFSMTDVATPGFDDARSLCLAMPHRIGVVAIPCDVFYDTATLGSRYVRWAFCKSGEVIDGAVDALMGL